MLTIAVQSSKRVEFINITQKLQQILTENLFKNGVLVVFCPHTTAGLTINEAFDSDVVKDITGALAEFVPPKGVGDLLFKHAEGNSDAHFKASLMGASITLIASEGQLQLGTWQGVFLCEFDGTRKRKLFIQWLPE